MAGLRTASAEFSFSERPTPVPGDLRINWRLSVLLLILENSRARKASLAKLYIISDAVRSELSRQQLGRVLSENLLPLEWTVRVEPALARAVDLLVGEGLARWIQMSGKAGIEATPVGAAAAAEIASTPDVLIHEKVVISELTKPLTEAKVSSILATHGSL